MELQTISQISKLFGIPTRTLRYYEQIGLIQPTKKEDFAYRAYDNAAVQRLQQILVLRHLRGRFRFRQIRQLQLFVERIRLQASHRAIQPARFSHGARDGLQRKRYAPVPS